MGMNNQDAAWCICVDAPLKSAVVRFHRESEKAAGHLSRSSIIRLLLRRGLMAKTGGLGDLQLDDSTRVDDDSLADPEDVGGSRLGDPTEVSAATP